MQQPPAPANDITLPVKRHKRAEDQTWKQNIMKSKRLKGEIYMKKNGEEEDERKIGPPCTSKYCQKSSLRSCQSLNQEQRDWIFNTFWSMESWPERHLYIQTLVEKHGIKQKKVEHGQSQRKCSLQDRLKLPDGSVLAVCKKMFASTFGVPERTIASWLEDPTNSEPKLKKPLSGKTAPIAEADQAFLNQWLTGLPTVPSHYCRSTATYQNKTFLEPGTTLANLHREYKKTAEDAGHRAVCSKLFSEAFHKLNFSVFIPGKDQCDTCISAKHGNIDNAIYLAHIQAKDEARAEKSKDKANASSKISAWTVDVQAVLLCPKTKASALYYKTKLQVHNLSFFNLQTHEGYCYVWDETQGDLNSEMFAHLQYHHFSQVLDAHPEIEEIIVWSDGCSYQNRNSTLANAYIDLAEHRGVTISQKYLVVGHTQMEVDSMHSMIEKRTVGDVYTPRDYMVIMESARMRPAPYVVKPVYHHEILKMNGAYVQSIRPGKVTGDPTVFQLRALQYKPKGVLKYKLNFTGVKLGDFAAKSYHPKETISMDTVSSISTANQIEEVQRPPVNETCVATMCT